MEIDHMGVLCCSNWQHHCPTVYLHMGDKYVFLPDRQTSDLLLAESVSLRSEWKKK